MGRIDEYTRRVYAEILMGFIKKDYKRVAEVHFEAGYISSDQDVDLFAQALRSVGEPIFGQNAENISWLNFCLICLTSLKDLEWKHGQSLFFYNAQWLLLKAFQDH
jgi:predicted unusual protein kinase regulating ubiquinone biosynthesis (AarF/ABC1/UbiB family)